MGPMSGMVPMSQVNPSLSRSLAWTALATLAVAGALVGIGWLPTLRIGGPGSATAMICGIGVATLGMLAGLVPAVLSRSRDPRTAGTALFAGTAVRFLVTLALLGAALLSGLEPRPVLAVWAALAYLVLLAVETAGLVRISRRTARSDS